MNGKVILIVVDNPAHRVMFNRYLQKTPHHLVFCADGEDGYDRFLEVKPSLIIAHINVARLDGTILCQLVRQQPGGVNVPFLLIGEEANDPERVRKRIEAVGADRFMPLPFSARILLDCVTPMLELGRAPTIQAIVDPPTLPLPASDLTLSPVGGVDFTDRNEALLAQPLPASIHESGDLPVPMISTETPDMDTVVSFKNPFYDPPAPIAETVRPQATLAAPTPRAGAVPVEVAAEDPSAPLRHEQSPSLVAPMIPEADPMTTGQLVAALDFLAETAGSQPTIGRSPVPRMDTLDAVPTIEPALPPPSVSSIEEPIIPGGVTRQIPDKDLSTQSRLIQEPAINPGTNPGKGNGASSREDISTKSRLIQEQPLREERTPTGDRSGAKVGLVAPGVSGAGAGAAVRRGLDESQLGKRLAKRVRTMHRLLDEVDFYQLLGVEPGASITQLRSSYFDLSLEFHPDRFFLLRSGELKEKIYAIYRKLSEAYRTLADEASRKSYDQARASRTSSVESIKIQPKPAATLQAATDLGLASEATKAAPLADMSAAAFAAGDANGARLFLKLALHYDPKNASYAAALDKILSRLGPSL